MSEASAGPVHFIAHFTVNDPDVYRQYEKGFFPVLKPFGARFVTFDDNVTVLEGATGRGPHCRHRVPIGRSADAVVGLARVHRTGQTAPCERDHPFGQPRSRYSWQVTARPLDLSKSSGHGPRPRLQTY